MWQDAWRVWFLTFITHVNSGNIVVGKHSTTMQIRIVSRLWFCKKLWRLKIDIRWTLMHIRESHVCVNKLDVNRHQSHTAQQKLILFFWMQERNSRAWSFFFWSVIEVFLSPKQINKSKSQESQRNLSWKHHTPYEKPKFNQARRSWSE